MKKQMYIMSRCVKPNDLSSFIKGKNDYTFIYEEPEWVLKHGIKDERIFKCYQEFGFHNIVKINCKPSGEEKIDQLCGLDITISTGLVYNSDIHIHERDVTSFIKDYLLILNNNCKKVMIDITCMNLRLISTIISLMPLYEWESIIVCYTEPKEYIKATDASNQYSLNNNTLGNSELPGLEKISSDMYIKDYWCVFIGYDKGRMNAIETEIETNMEYEFPVVCVPSMHPEWHNESIFANEDMLETSTKIDSIEYVSATNPFDVYNYLISKTNGINYNSNRLMISPLSTKPVLLGVILYMIDNDRDITLTDNPYQFDKGHEDAGKSHYYDLTSFIREHKNIRYDRPEEDYDTILEKYYNS